MRKYQGTLRGLVSLERPHFRLSQNVPFLQDGESPNRGQDQYRLLLQNIPTPLSHLMGNFKFWREIVGSDNRKTLRPRSKQYGAMDTNFLYVVSLVVYWVAH